MFKTLKIYGTSILYTTRMSTVGYDRLLISWVMQSRDNTCSSFFKLQLGSLDIEHQEDAVSHFGRVSYVVAVTTGNICIRACGFT